MSDSQSAFSRLSPFIREYIYKHNWDGLRPVQEQACKVIFDTGDHLILASGTASGKTEAAFLPILTLLEKDPPSSAGILYIAPMKSLINDQFFRLTDLLDQSGIPVCHWHGDAPRNLKSRFLRNPGGVLQITPESLESMLINRSRELTKIFCDLRYIIIDEMHAFMNSERGLQVICQLARLSRYINAEPRRVGLSATLGDYRLPAEWLAAGTNKNVSIPQAVTSGQKIRISAERFDGDIFDEGHGLFNHPAMSYIYERTVNKKAIIFGNGRPETDAAITAMRHLARKNGTPDIYHVHHGAISSTLRETAEHDMKNSEGPVVIGATVTMELGVDIGRLERVFQIGSPISVASFVQRLGRTGRRGEPPEMWFVDCERRREGSPAPFQSIPWYLLKTIAIVQLYIEEHWIEPPKILKCSMSMLYHQIMSTVAAAGEISVSALIGAMAALPAFYEVEHEDILYFVEELVSMEHLQHMDQGGLIIGLEGEKITNSYDFYGVFPSEEEWIVMNGSQKIGHVEEAHFAGEQITVAGYNWLVVGVDLKRLSIFVRPMPENYKYWWPGDRALTHDRILQRMKTALSECAVYPYLGPDAAARLQEGREAASAYGFDKYNVIGFETGGIGILPWMGHRNYRTLRNILAHYLKTGGIPAQIGGSGCFYMTLAGAGARSGKGGLAGAGGRFAEGGGDGWSRAADSLEAIKAIFANEINPYDFLREDSIRAEKKHYEYKVPKYDRFVPNVLLKKQIVSDYIDIPYIKEQVAGWRVNEY